MNARRSRAIGNHGTPVVAAPRRSPRPLAHLPPSPTPLADLLRADARAHAELGERVLPECPQKRDVLATCRGILDAAERRAGIALVDWRGDRGARADAPAPARDDTPTSSPTNPAATLEPPADAVALLPPVALRARLVRDLAPPAGGPGRVAPWWFADAIVVVASAADKRQGTTWEEAEAEEEEDDEEVEEEEEEEDEEEEDDEFFSREGRRRDSDGNLRRPRARDRATQHPPPSSSSSTSTASTSTHCALSRTRVGALARSARRLGPLGASSAFLLVERCDGRDGRPSARDAAKATAAATGLPLANVLCCEGTLEEADAAPARAAAPWRAAVTTWYDAWAEHRSAKMWPEYVDARETVRFWAALAAPEVRKGGGGERGGGVESGGGITIGATGGVFGTGGGTSNASDASAGNREIGEASRRLHDETEAKAKARAEAGDGDAGGGGGGGVAGAETLNPKASGDPSASAPSAASSIASRATELHASAALLSLGSFLRTAVEGIPSLGVVGAPEMASRYLRSDPDLTRRASLSATLYSTNAVEYAAGFFLSWTVPGPLAAHAAHFTNRFRVCLAAACLAGESPLDPRTVATAAAVCAGADAARVRDAAFESAAKSASVAAMEADASRRAKEEKEEKEEKEGREGREGMEGREGREGKEGKEGAEGTNGADPGEGDAEGHASGSDASAFLSRSTRSAMARVGAKMDAALSKAMDGGRDLRARAASAMRATYAASASAVADAEAKALAAATRARDALLAVPEEEEEEEEDADVARPSRPSRLSPRRPSSRRTHHSRLSKPTGAMISAATNRVFSAVLRRETTAALASTVCGPLWLAATQADVASVVAGAMSVYVTDASVSLFLPRMRAAEEAELARRAAALTVDDGVVVVSLDVDLNDDGELAVAAKVTAAPAPGFVVARAMARRARGGFESAMEAAREATEAASAAANTAANTAASAASAASESAARWLTGAWSDGARAVGRGADLVAASFPAAFLRNVNDGAGASADAEAPTASLGLGASANGSTTTTTFGSEDHFDPEAYEPLDLDEVDPAIVSALAEDPETRRVLSQPSALVRLMSDAAVVAALRDPETSRACSEFVRDPSTFAVRREDPKFAAVARRAMAVAGAAGGSAGVALMRKHGLLRRKKETTPGPTPEEAAEAEARRKRDATEARAASRARADAVAAKYAARRDEAAEGREGGGGGGEDGDAAKNQPSRSSARKTSETNSKQSATSASSAYAWTSGLSVPSLADLGGLFGASSPAPTAPTRKSDAIAAKYAAKAVDA